MIQRETGEITLNLTDEPYTNSGSKISPIPIDPTALLNLWSLEELPACDEGMEHALPVPARPLAGSRTMIVLRASRGLQEVS